MRLAPLLALLLLIPLAATALVIGPAVGTRAPALHAINGAGEAVSVSGISGRKGVVLLFFRSAKWCPYCQKQLMDFQAAEAPLAARGYTLAALSYDPPAVTREFAAKRGLTYAFLSDPGSVTIDAFKLRDPQYPVGHFAYGVPKPAIFVLSRKGMVQAQIAEDGYKVRPTVEAVLAAVDQIAH